MSKQKPVILITGFKDTPKKDIHLERNGANRTVVESMLGAGGLPLIYPLNLNASDLKHAAEIADGLYIPGGEDVHPRFFSKTEKVHKNVFLLSEERDQMEIAFVKLFRKLKKPILGICRGIQIINVALGGDLYQDIGSALKTKKRHHPDLKKVTLEDYSREVHDVIIEPKTAIRKMYRKETIRVNSLHHQAIRKLAHSLRVNAYSEDGIIEGAESKNMDEHWIIGVQWHPEILVETRPENKLLFSAFVKACKKKS